ncbi:MULTISPECIES: hypothetical protein [Nocardiaceae]|uniref:hypothetical protein n=1 Tax=Nocardiaceae TaxID=85025 RepID=UPI000A9902DB|nr:MULTISPECIES: hypothetical protein [Rhodococcus]OZD20604.1 hypothetical protein CH280_03410 [Rhodococcus sp. 06-156-4C]OZD30677.1 hypothetical protein CH247_15315 [Rhodococcus sp. 06-156-3b]OZF65039.1 hypothetical protein CH290_10640 [Rhodococcus sp. 06-156-4]
MAGHSGNNDPYQLSLLWYRNDGLGALETDMPYRASPLPDGRVLTAWTSRTQLSEELYDYVEHTVQLSRNSPDFPQPGELCQPAYHGYVEWPNLTPTDQLWQFASSPEELAAELRQEHGAIMPATMRHDLYADSTLAHYGDLHVDHVAAVIQMDAVRRDIAALRLADTPTATMAARSHLAVLEDHQRVLIADLNARRENTIRRLCPTSELIGAQTAEWTQDARVHELRTWPGGAHTQRAIAELDQATTAMKTSPAIDAWDTFDTFFDLHQNFSTTMSQARIQEWGDPSTSRPSVMSNTPLPAMTLTEADLRQRAHQRSNPVDRGIRREPKQPAPRATDTAEHQRHQNRIEIAHQIEHRRPSM